MSEHFCARLYRRAFFCSNGFDSVILKPTKRGASMAWILAVLTLPAAFYAHYRLPEYSEGKAALWFTRLFLIGLGLGFGWAVSVRYFPVMGEWNQLWVFLSAFGVAHIPAAGVLLIKHIRRHS
ncbi:hypothetical protein [Marinimicrobium sp. ABcell2]|uniref:hypothetical protein n=1 Tax=Marinimicrobium sp. ABcell2 TaxID=3069751 RepID=UPI0027ADCB7F|nr:hypothetical protein [Marinimicrobium sp. ABcell2]MDQ2077770.1 hypothetical protein [Marinimicrobium sp. ABcell2]